jgi:protein-tyrosine kinase
MSADEFIYLPQDLDDEPIESLISHYGLTPEAATQIRDIMRNEHVQWSEAAALSGLLTPAQIEEAVQRTARAYDSSRGGIIESALRRSSSRQVVKVQGPEVKPGPQLIFAHDPYNARSEKIRALRTELLLLSDGSAMVLAIVGSGPAEGRSLLAAELAVAFGQLGRRTLLVDADMRQPCQHLLFQTSNTLGLAQSIEGPHQATLYRIAGLPATSLLTAGTSPSNPLELLSDQRFERLIHTWRKQFEFIIIDTPPVSRFADGLNVAALAGRVLVVSRSVATTFKDLKEMLRRLALTRSQVLGAIINDF